MLPDVAGMLPGVPCMLAGVPVMLSGVPGMLPCVWVQQHSIPLTITPHEEHKPALIQRYTHNNKGE
jgi:hypothetical protein